MKIDVQKVQETRRSLREHVMETILHEFDVERMELSRESRQSKYEKMAESPYRFFRGSAYLFYYDVSKFPELYDRTTTQPIWIQGDMHMDNFGCFQNEVGDIVYDANDFDEGYVGSYMYDLVRMAVSIALYTDAEQVEEKQQVALIEHFLYTYYAQIERFATGKENPVTMSYTAKNTKKPIKKILKKLERKKQEQFVTDLTYIDSDGHLVFNESDEIKVLHGAQEQAVRRVIEAYVQTIFMDKKVTYKIGQIALKFGSGTASIGLERYYILVEGVQDASGTRTLVLEMKEARPPVPAYFLPYNEPFWELYAHQGQRVVATQKAMHHLEDPYLGYTTIGTKEYYIRERSPFKKKVKPKQLKTVKDYEKTLEVMAKVAAKIHARAEVLTTTTYTHSEQEIMKAMKNAERFTRTISRIAFLYKQQVKVDFEIFQKLIQRLH